MVAAMSSRWAVSTTECMLRSGRETKALGTPSRVWKILSVSVPVKRLLASCCSGIFPACATLMIFSTTKGWLAVP